MAKISLSPHAKDRTLARIGSKRLAEFVAGVKKAPTPTGERRWAIKVLKGPDVLGYAVGRGTVWMTTLDGGKSPDPDSEIIVVRV